MKSPSLSPPVELVGDDVDNTFKCKVYFELLRRHLNEKETMTNNLHSLFSILWDQCSAGVQSKLTGKIENSSRKKTETVLGFWKKFVRRCSISAPVVTSSEACMTRSWSSSSSTKEDCRQCITLTSTSSKSMLLNTLGVRLDKIVGLWNMLIYGMKTWLMLTPMKLLSLEKSLLSSKLARMPLSPGNRLIHSKHRLKHSLKT